MRYWRFNYESESTLEAIVSTQGLVAPLKLHPSGKNNPVDIINNKLRVGDGILLAKLAGTECSVQALGIVRSKAKGLPDILIDWRRVNVSRTPNPRGGLAQWQKEACFKFAEAPAKNYGLDSLFATHFSAHPRD